MSSSSKTLFKAALRYSDIIDKAYFENGGKIIANEEIESAINVLIKNRLAWRLDDMDGAQLSSSLISLLSRTGSAAKRSRGSAEISSLWCQLEELLEDYIIAKTIQSADVICCTLVGSVSKHIEKLHFDTLIIDEAAQALEPATWIPIGKANKIIFAGDPFQLPPTVKCFDAAQKGLNITLLEKGVQRPSYWV